MPKNGNDAPALTPYTIFKLFKGDIPIMLTADQMKKNQEFYSLIIKSIRYSFISF